VSTAEREIPFAIRLGLWCSAWIVACVLLAPDASVLPYAWLFPIGFFWRIGVRGSDVRLFLALGWIVYAVLTWFVLVEGRRTAFLRAFFILFALLIVNAAGCRQLLHS
jgi:hypothetical protein